MTVRASVNKAGALHADETRQKSKPGTFAFDTLECHVARIGSIVHAADKPVCHVTAG